MYQDRRGRVWLGTAAGLGYFADTRFVRVAEAPAGFVDAITEDTEGNVWIANRDAGLLRISVDGAVEQFGWASLKRGFATWVWRVASDPVQGGVWLAYHAGRVAYFRSGKVQVTYSRAEGLGSGAVHDIRVSADGTVWVGTDGGLSRIRAGRVATLSSANGLPCNSVDSTIEDAGGGIWLYTPCGVVHLPPAEMRGWTDVIDRGDVAPQVRPIVLDSRDGAPRAVASSLTMTPHVAIGADGKIWLAAQDGVAVVDSVQLPRNAIPPPVHIEQLVADRRAYDARTGVRLPPLVRDLQIDYTALSLVAPEKNTFRIMLEGRDAEWQDVGTRRQAFYTDLGPGAYRFRVIASNNSGVWNEAGATLEFSIAPAYYQTRWFQALVVASALGLVWAGYRGRVRQVARQYQRRLDERVNERTRIARELHDTLLQSFHGLLLRFQTASYLLPERPAEAKAQLDGAIDHAAKAITEGRDAVQGLRASTVERNDLAIAIQNPGRRAREPRERADAARIQRRRRGRDAGSASDRPRRDLQDRGGSPAQRLPACAGRASRGRDPLRRRAVPIARARRWQRDRSEGARQPGARGTLRVARHAGTSRADRRGTGGLE